jgi:K+-transporting ATPase ATPase A chain
MRWFEYAAFLGIVVLLARPISLYLRRVFCGRNTFLDRVCLPVEVQIYRLMGVDSTHEMTSAEYLLAFLAFSIFSAVFLFLILILQRWFPGGPDVHYLSTPLTTDLASNTAVSFATTTTWQAYSGETTLKYFTQVFGLAAQNFLGGAAGLAIGLAFIRGFVREHSKTIGNFWVDLVRSLLWVLIPLSWVGGLFLVWQGVPLNFTEYTQAHTREVSVQTIAQGPVAVLEFIKNLGTNGGGFFNANGAHPYENPTPLSNFVEMLAIAAIPAAFPLLFGQMVGRPRVGWLLLTIMLILFMAGLIICDRAETANPPWLADLAVTGGNMEGKETRFGVGGSVLAGVVTSNCATGSYNSMHGSFQPIGVLVLLINMLLGELVFGGLGTGLYSLLMIALVAVFLGGLMVGRSPEYVGKTIGPTEAKLVAFYALITPLVVLPLAGWAVSSTAGRAGLVTNDGVRGFTEIVFAYASCMANNGQNMAGLNANSAFYNTTTLLAMLAGRFVLTALALVLAGRFAQQGRKEETTGTLPGDTITFGFLVLGTILLIGALSFLPVLALGPVAEYLKSAAGT